LPHTRKDWLGHGQFLLNRRLLKHFIYDGFSDEGKLEDASMVRLWPVVELHAYIIKLPLTDCQQIQRNIIMSTQIYFILQNGF
jgi:hypothetical protein